MNEKARYFLEQVKAKNGEHEQILLRLIFSLSVFFYLLYEFRSDKSFLHVLLFSTAWLLLTVVIAFVVFVKKNTSRSRQLITMLGDITAVTYVMSITQESGVILYGIYLWVIIGNGLRYGIPSLISSYAYSIIGFASVILFNVYWHEHPLISTGLMLTLILIPLYVIKLRNQLNKALESAVKANKAKSTFVANMSHEMRTPLNGVIGVSNLLGDSKLNEDQKDLVSMLKNSAQLLLQLIDNVLDLSKIESGKITPISEPFNLHELLKNTQKMFVQQAEAKGLEFQFRMSPGLPSMVMGDTLHLRQVLTNLLGNAIKFTNKGTVELRISIVTQDATHALLKFEVIDTGIGISSDAQKHIFESFTQADENITRNYGGTGLGTTISKHLIMLMGGQMGVQSAIGIGSIFWFELVFEKQESPEYRNNHVEVDTSNTIPENIDSSPFSKDVIAIWDHYENSCVEKRGVNILVADDNGTNRKVLVKILQRAGHSVEAVNSGEKALDRLEANHFDLMILDMHMPDMGGLEIIKVHRATRLNDITPVMILTANAMIEAQRECEAAGVDSYMTKPFDPLVLLNTVNRLTGSIVKIADMPVVTLRPQLFEAAGEQFINLNKLYQLLLLGEGREDFLNIVINGFIKETELQLVAMNSAMIKHEFQSFKDISHAIRGGAGNVGAETLENICRSIMLQNPASLKSSADELMQKVHLCFNTTKVILVQSVSILIAESQLQKKGRKS
jgi:two-component system sensor histidine kinase RpfC